MTLRLLPSLLLLSCLAPAAQAAPETEATANDSAPAARVVFGPYEAIVYDRNYLADVRVDAKGDIFLKFNPERRDARVGIRISMQEGAGYRKWFNGDDELMAQENGSREPHRWTDRVQTSAHYIEYRDGPHLFLHLKKIDS